MKTDLYHKVIHVPIYELDVDLIFTKDIDLAERHIDEQFPGIGYAPAMDQRGASLLIKSPEAPAQVLVVINVAGERNDFDVNNDMIIQATHVAWILSDLLGHDPTMDNHTGHSHIIKYMINRMKDVWSEAVTETDIEDL